MEATREKLVSDFKVLIDDAEALLRATAGQAGETVDAVRERIARSLDEGKQSLAETEDVLLATGKEAVTAADAYVRERPWNAVGIAAGVGLVLGLLVRRK